MGMFDPKKRKLVTAIIAVILVLAMVVPTVLEKRLWKHCRLKSAGFLRLETNWWWLEPLLFTAQRRLQGKSMRF